MDTQFGTTIPAQPGYFVLSYHSEGDTQKYYQEAIIAWHIVKSGRGEYVDSGDFTVTAITIDGNGTKEFDSYILTPAGQVIAREVATFDGISQWLKHMKD